MTVKPKKKPDEKTPAKSAVKKMPAKPAVKKAAKKTPAKKPPTKQAAKKPVKKHKSKAASADNLPSDGGIVIVEDDIIFDQEKDNEMRKAYLEEHRSQEASD